MTAPRFRALTLAIHPSTYGFGWIAFEGPFAPYDWGTVEARKGDKNAKCLRRIERLFDRLTPQTLVLETFERANSARRDRITKLGRAIVALAIDRRIEVAIHRFADVQQCFVHLGARTRWEIAQALAQQFEQFAHLLPRKPRLWDAVNKRMALFSAAALALTNYQRDARNLLDGLSKG